MHHVIVAAALLIVTPAEWGLEAAIVLSSPTESPIAEPDDPLAWSSFRAAILLRAEREEILDPREMHHMLARGRWQSDVDELRRRAAELADAPPLAAMHELPEVDVLQAGCEWSQEFRAFVSERAELEPDRFEELNLVLCECDALYRLWDAARDARCRHYYTLTRRRALLRIQDAGGLPPMPVPTWRYARINP